MTTVSLRKEAQAYLDFVGARHRPEERGDRAALEQLLKDRELPVYDALFEIEARVGGYTIADPSGDTKFGTYILLVEQLPESRPGWAVQSYEGSSLVWVGATSATVLYATTDGVIVEADFYSGGVVPVAADIDGWLGRCHLPILDDEAGLTHLEHIGGRAGEHLAAALSLKSDPAYSDAFHSRWIGAGYSVVETRYPYDGAATTSVAAATAEQLQRALAAASTGA